MATQCEQVMEYMERFGSITTMQAYEDLGVTRLASRINDLRNQGIDIEGTTRTGKNRFGKKVSFKEYRLKEETCKQGTL